MKAEISRRSLMKTSALGSLALASSAFTLPFSQMVRAAEAPVEEKAVWSSCTVNCGSRCLLRLHVKDDTVYWVESDTTGDDVYGNHQVRACLRGRSIRRRMNHPDRLKYPMKRVGKRGEGKFERISWDEALDTISDNLRRILKDYGNEAVHVLYGTGVDGGNITNSNVPYRLMNSCGILPMTATSHHNPPTAKNMEPAAISLLRPEAPIRFSELNARSGDPRCMTEAINPTPINSQRKNMPRTIR